jgi:hypothetical protein
MDCGPLIMNFSPGARYVVLLLYKGVGFTMLGTNRMIRHARHVHLENRYNFFAHRLSVTSSPRHGHPPYLFTGPFTATLEILCDLSSSMIISSSPQPHHIDCRQRHLRHAGRLRNINQHGSGCIF